MTLEHILPQSSDKGDFKGLIGNLLPLGSDLNASADKKELSRKIEIYKKSDFLTAKEFAASNVRSWEKKDIKARTLALAEYCYNSIQV